MKKLVVFVMVMAMVLTFNASAENDHCIGISTDGKVIHTSWHFDKALDFGTFLILDQDDTIVKSLVFVVEDGYNYDLYDRVDVYHQYGGLKVHIPMSVKGFYEYMKGVDDCWDITSRSYYDVETGSQFGISFDYDGD